MALKRITVLISGRGSNLAALVAASRSTDFNGTVTHVVSNRPDAAGLDFARANAIATSVVDSKAFADRDAFEDELARTIDAGSPDLCVLAGFMRVLGSRFVARYADRMLNIHPSLLPAYPGLHTHRRALADAVREHGCTVHFVTPDVDGGPIIAQSRVPVCPDDDEPTLAARVLDQEHRLLPSVVGAYCAGRVALVGGRVWCATHPLPDVRFVAM
ncbi:MAG TPA: phosphoribosylglycinamide formyltransferase [Casimicrobiaceae bacterium]|nr:phosphoribosylglycinamide formyltransferase [Casimicrobiaceae bacterium]